MNGAEQFDPIKIVLTIMNHRVFTLNAINPLSGKRLDLRHPGLLVPLLALVVYLLLPTKQYYWDGVGFSLSIEAPHCSAAALLHPNHLIYNLIGYALWRGVSATGISVRALFVLQAVNGLFAAATIFLFWRILKQLTRSPWRSTVGALVLAFSATWWRFSTDANAYIPSIFFLIVCLQILMMPQPRPIAAGLFNGVAMLFHQLAIFFVPVAMVAFLCVTGDRGCVGGKRARFLEAAQYIIAAFSITAMAYGLGFAAVGHSGLNLTFWNWITTRAIDAKFAFNLPRSALLTLRGTVRLLMGGRFTSAKLNVISFGATTALLLVIVVVCYFARARSANGSQGYPCKNGFRSWISANRLALTWSLSYSCFLAFWLPQNTFYRLFYLPALIQLIMTVPGSGNKNRRFVEFACAVMVGCNFLFCIYPLSRVENNDVLAFALIHHGEWNERSAIAYSDFHTDLWTISYFNPQAKWAAISSPTIGQVERRLLECKQQRTSFWLEATTYDAIAGLPGGTNWLDKHVDRARSLNYITLKHRIRFYRLD